MATYYVDFVNGLDANNGLGPDASAGTNKPWKTLTKALGAAGAASGDTIYLSPAGPFREIVTVAMTSATVETKILGDPGNAQGFKTSGGVAVNPGPVMVTAYTTNDKTAPSNSAPLALAGRDFLTFQYIMFVGGTSSPSASCVDATTSVSTDCKFMDCAFLANAAADVSISYTSAAGTASNFLFDRCVFFTRTRNVTAGGFAITLNRHTADYDVNFTIQNCVIQGSGGTTMVRVASTGAGVGFGGGVKVRNCSFLGVGGALATGDANLSTTIPCTVTNSVLMGAGSMLNANALGQITEDYNLISATTTRTNVTAGTHSVSNNSYSHLFHFGQEQIWGMNTRPPGEPMAGSPLLGFGNDGTQTAYDVFNRPRPAGGASPSPGVGGLERGNTFGKEITTVHTGTAAISATGPAYHDFQIPVDNTATTITVFDRFDATYAGTKPQILLLANTEVGVAAQTVTDTGSSGAWNQISLAAFTPTGKGIVTIRLVSNDTNGGGKCFFDSLAVA